MRLRVLLFSLLLSGAAQAQTARPVVARPALTAVTLFLNAAQLTHQGTVTLPTGTSQVLVRNLARGLDEETLEVRFGAGAELVDVGAELDDLPPVPANQLVQDSIGRLTAERERVKAELAALQEERAFWLANRTLPAGTQAGWSTELQKGATLLRTRLVSNQLESSRLTARDAELTRKITGMETRLGSDDEPSNDDVVLTVRAERAGSFALTVRYFTNHSDRKVHWEPQLDIRSDDTARKLSFVKRGRIYNSTQLDWQRVRVTLVDQLLAANVSRPTLAPWSLDFNGGDQIGEGRIDEFVVKGSAEGKAAAAPQSNRYELPEPVTLPEKSRRTVSLSAVTLPARPEFLAVPKLSDKVFLQAKVTGWEGLQLPSEADVYYRGAYAGQTELETEAYNDSLELSLGYDERISVRRAKLEDISSKVGLGGNRRVHLAYELNVRNQHPQAIRIRVLDQVPVPGDKAIQVKVSETSGAQLEERTGKLTWLLTLAPNTSQKLKFSFDVDYPQDKKVEIIQHRRRISTLKTR